MMKKLASDFFLKNVSCQTLSLVVFYPKPMQNVQLLAFLYNYCAKSQIKPTIVFLPLFPLRSLVLRRHEQILWTKIVNGIVSFIQKVGNFK